MSCGTQDNTYVVVRKEIFRHVTLLLEVGFAILLHLRIYKNEWNELKITLEITNFLL